MIAEIERKIVKRSQRNRISRAFHANEDKSAIIAWNRNLDRILQIFSVRSLCVVWQLLRVSFSGGAVNQ